MCRKVNKSHKDCLSCKKIPKIYHVHQIHISQLWSQSQQAHDVHTTSTPRRCNVMTLSRRWGDVVLTTCACWDCFCFCPILSYPSRHMTFIQLRLNVTLRRRCINVMCPLGWVSMGWSKNSFFYISRSVRKRTFGYVRPAKNQSSLRVRSVWSESSLGGFRMAKDADFFFYVDSETDHIARMGRLIWVFHGRSFPKVRFLTLRLIKFHWSRWLLETLWNRHLRHW